MDVAAEAMAEHPGGGAAAAMPAAQFLAALDLACASGGAALDKGARKEAMDYLESAALRQEGKLTPQNLRAEECRGLMY